MQQDYTSATGQVRKTKLLLPDIDWVEIPAGEFIYGEDDSQQTLNLDKFYISRYLITNRQFQTFIDAGGYQDERWWQDIQHMKPETQLWSWANQPQANRPREAVSWYEAVAFSHWLSEQLAYQISLPTDLQWEKAARGTDGRHYPWGNDIAMGDANVKESSDKEQNLGETTAVGMYPHRASPYAVQDMAGNVWEWCLNKSNRPEDIEVDNSEAERFVRGGSWFDDPVFARCAGRLRFLPDYRHNVIGFRVVCLSPLSDY